MWHNWAEKENGDINTDEENTTKKKTKKDSLMDEENISNQKKNYFTGKGYRCHRICITNNGTRSMKDEFVHECRKCRCREESSLFKGCGGGGQQRCGPQKKKKKLGDLCWCVLQVENDRECKKEGWRRGADMRSTIYLVFRSLGSDGVVGLENRFMTLEIIW